MLIGANCRFLKGMKKVGSVLRADFYVYKDLP